VTVNGRRLTVAWEFGSAVHDADGAPVLGVCEIDAALPDTAVVSVNGQAVAGRPDLAASTAAHELGHVLFDVPPALASADPQRRYRATLSRAEDLLDRTTARAERRANEFMGALLAPAGPLHMRLLVHARAEGLRMVHAAHHGRPGSRILAASNPPDAVAGVLAALADDFGVSERFIAVRLQRYRLIQGVRLP
jgi:Zn-dependent peptidase ImmA (M78 family)